MARKYFVCIGGHVRKDGEVLFILSLLLHARLIAMVIFTWYSMFIFQTKYSNMTVCPRGTYDYGQQAITFILYLAYTFNYTYRHII
jgi:hypothetical protein